MINISDVQTRYGILKIPNIDTDIIGRFVAKYGEWADLEIRLAAELVRPGAAVADIGAFVGTFGIGLSQRKQINNVCFVEANSLVFPILQSNVRRCCRASAVTLNQAAAPKGFALRDAFMEPGNLGSASISDQGNPTLLSRIPAPAMSISLPTLLAEHGPFDLIKMDIEGLEAAVLAEDKNIMSRKNITFLVECREDRASLELFSVLKLSDRALYYYSFPSFNPANYSANSSAIFPYAFESGLLLTDADDFVISAELQALGVVCERVDDVEALKSALWHTPRWCPENWWGKPPATIVALATRSLIGLTYETFLSEDDALTQVEAPHQQLHRTQETLEEAQVFVQQRTENPATPAAALATSEAARRDAEALASKLLGQVDDLRVAAGASEKIIRDLRSIIAARDISLSNAEKRGEFLQTLAEHRMLLLRNEASKDLDLTMHHKSDSKKRPWLRWCLNRLKTFVMTRHLLPKRHSSRQNAP